jgi:hypothetical protein
MDMTQENIRKKELDTQRTEWRRSHRALNGKIILYPDKPPEHINARGNKIYNWFWKQILLSANMHDIPAIITGIKQHISHETDGRKIRTFRTMIGMADDAYKLKQLEDIDRFDSELQLGDSTVYNSDQGIIYKNGIYYITDLTEEEDKILIRDMEGIIIDIHYDGNEKKEEKIPSPISISETYKDWEYMKKT